MPTHSIRLAGPWKVQWLEPVQADAPFACEAAVSLPRDWIRLFGCRAGAARFRRTFHRPTNLEPQQRIAVEFDGVRGVGTVRLNNVTLGEIAADTTWARFDITSVLVGAQTFQLVVELAFDPVASTEPGGLYDSVRLVIESGD